MRKLASIQSVLELNPIEGKDRIELAIISGWQIIVKKGEYIVGDKTIFVEIDSILPDKPEYEFLRSKKFRIRTMKMGGILSQGICFPMSILPQDKEYNLEDDVTDILGILKYEPNEDNADIKEDVVEKNRNFIMRYLFRFKFIRKLFLPKKESKGFPSFISKTDEIRVQNIPHILKNKDLKFVAREKIDGASGTFFLKRIHKKWFWQEDGFEFGVCSRNLRLWKEDNSTYWTVARKYNLETVLRQLINDGDFVAIQGEVVAPSVQGNKYKVTEPDLYCFNLILPSTKVTCETAEPLFKLCGIKWCPLIEREFTLLDTVNEMLDYATGESQLHTTMREGIVFRNYEKNISFKAVSPDFLIKHNE